MKKLLFTLGLLSFGLLRLGAQNLDSLLAAEEGNGSKEFVTTTFKGTRLINFHTVEVPGRHTLDFRISHRFGDLSQGAYELFGIDGPANIRLGLEYSFDGRFAFGAGRTSRPDKLFDGFLKYQLLRQTEGSNKMPVTLTLLSGANIVTLKDPVAYPEFVHRLQYQHQIMIARKFSEQLSFQVSPTFIHYNSVEGQNDNNAYAVVGLGRWKFTRSVALTAEYAYRLNPEGFKNMDPSTPYRNSVGAGFDIETGGHVFQLFFTNSQGIIESQTITQTLGDVSKGNLKFGFNVSRVFTL